MSRRRCITSIVLFLLALPGAHAIAQASADEATVKAAFVYNFLKFVEWPAHVFGSPQAPVVVAVVGEGEIADATARFLTSKQIGARPIAVRRAMKAGSLAGAVAVFLAADVATQRRLFGGAPWVLTIGEGEEFAREGGVIGLLIEDRKVRFDVNLDAAQAAGLKISSRMLALARFVYSTPGNGARP